MNEPSSSHFCILSTITFLPLVGVLFLWITPQLGTLGTKRIGLAGSLLPLPFILFGVLPNFDINQTGLQLKTKLIWIHLLDWYYYVGIDGLSLPLILLVSVIVPLVILGIDIFKQTDALTPTRGKLFFSLILLEQVGLYGTFTAIHFFHWFIYWEVALVPMFFLIKLFGSGERHRAALLFFVYTFVGSIVMLIGMQVLFLASGKSHWNLDELALAARTFNGGSQGLSVLQSDVQTFVNQLNIPFLTHHAMTLLCFMVALGFAVKVPLWPFHTWLPLTYTSAPTAGSMVLTGLMSKMGLYGFLRVILPIFLPELAPFANILLILAIMTVLAGAWGAIAQNNIKKLIAYSSVSHLGYCLLGVFSLSVAGGTASAQSMTLNGIVFQMVAHGLSAAGLFYFAGLLEERLLTRDLSEMGGLRAKIPVFCGTMGIVLFASLGLPGLAGFVGEYLIFQGIFSRTPICAFLAIPGLLLTAIYLLKLLTRAFFGEQNPKWLKIHDFTISDLNLREKVVAIILVISLAVLGMAPTPLLRLSKSIDKIVLK